MMLEPNLIFLQKLLKIKDFGQIWFFTTAGVWNFFNNCPFGRNWQKMKGRASIISCSSQNVRSMSWRLFWRIVKNARFHLTKHLSQWVSSQPRIGNLPWLFFAPTEIFYFFVSGGTSSSEMTTMLVPKVNFWILIAKNLDLAPTS